MPRRVLTVYNCGTAFNRDKGASTQPGKAGELIASLYDRTDAQDINRFGRLDLPAYSFKIIFDGPGSAPQDFARWETRGGRRRFVRYKASQSRAATPGVSRDAMWISRMMKRAGGLALGSGWEENVHSLMKTLRALTHPPEVVNLTGWSRGGITCHMMAGAILDVWPRTELNIFAVDPVAGGPKLVHTVHDWLSVEKRLGIPAEVARYAAVLAKHDRKLGFEVAQVDGGASSRTRRFYLMPGVHSTVVSGGPGLHGVAVLVEYLAAGFLAEAGTPFRSRLDLTEDEVLENYAIVKKTEGAYEELSGGVLTLFGLASKRKKLSGGVEKRSGVNQDVRETCFVNAHHEAVFRRAFPATYGLFFTGLKDVGTALDASTVMALSKNPALKAELDRMERRCRNTWAAVAPAIGIG
ncbi:MAG: hypothetical protein RJQ04_13220 [Longimicrobiales bacterium]